MQSMKYVIDETPYCVWGHDLKATNLRFLAGIDPFYFEHLAKIHSEALNSPERQYAAIALRTAYSHSLETLFAFLGAVIQAPRFPAAWVLRYQLKELRSLVKKIEDGANVLTSFRGTPVTWDTLAATINNFNSDFAEGDASLRRHFGRLWSRLAKDFLDDMATEEYNSIKHGFRSRPGGFALSVGVQDEPGVPAPPERMSSLGGSEFGTSFFRVERLDPPHNFWIRSCGRNWHPNNLAHGLALVSVSLANTLSFLRHVGGESDDDLLFRWPRDPAQFEYPWAISVGVTSLTLDTTVSQSSIIPATKEEILALFRECR